MLWKCKQQMLNPVAAPRPSSQTPAAFELIKFIIGDLTWWGAKTTIDLIETSLSPYAG